MSWGIKFKRGERTRTLLAPLARSLTHLHLVVRLCEVERLLAAVGHEQELDRPLEARGAHAGPVRRLLERVVRARRRVAGRGPRALLAVQVGADDIGSQVAVA